MHAAMSTCCLDACCNVVICQQHYVNHEDALYVTGENTVKGYTKLINKAGAYTEIANTGTDQKRCKE